MRWTLLLLTCLFCADAYPQSTPTLEAALAGRMSCGFAQLDTMPAFKLGMGCGTLPRSQKKIIRWECGSIVTKELNNCSVVVLDAADSLPIQLATITVQSTDEPISATTTVDGELVIPTCRRGEVLTTNASSIGYEARQVSIWFDSSQQVQSIFLHKQYKQMAEVVVIGSVIVCRRNVCRSGCTKIKCINFITVNRKDSNTKSMATVWPNPIANNQKLNVLLPESFDGNCQILSATGQLLQTTRFTTVKNQVVQIPTANWPNGTMFLRVQSRDGKGSSTHKFIIQ